MSSARILIVALGLSGCADDEDRANPIGPGAPSEEPVIPIALPPGDGGVDQAGPDPRCGWIMTVAADHDVEVVVEVDDVPVEPNPAGRAHLTALSLSEFTTHCQSGPFIDSDELLDGEAASFGFNTADDPNFGRAVVPASVLEDGGVVYVGLSHPATYGGFLLPSAASSVTTVVMSYTGDQVLSW